MRRDTSEQAGSAKGGKEVQKVTLLFDRDDLNSLRSVRGRMWSARRQYESYGQYVLIAMDELFARDLTDMIDLTDRILTCLDE